MQQKRLLPAIVAHRTVVVNTAHLDPVMPAVGVLGANVKSLRRKNLLPTVTMTTVRQEKTGVHGVDPPRDAADLPRDVCRQLDLHRGIGRRHAAMSLAAGVVPVEVLHDATTIEIVGMIAVMIEIAVALMAAVMIEIVVVLEIVAVVVVDLVTVVPVVASETAVGIAEEVASETAIGIAEEVASETAVGIAEEVDLTIAAEKEAIIVVTVEIAVEEVVDLEGVMINVMNVVVVEVILKEVGVNLLLGKKAVLFVTLYTYPFLFETLWRLLTPLLPMLGISNIYPT